MTSCSPFHLSMKSTIAITFTYWWWGKWVYTLLIGALLQMSLFKTFLPPHALIEAPSNLSPPSVSSLSKVSTCHRVHCLKLPMWNAGVERVAFSISKDLKVWMEFCLKQNWSSTSSISVKGKRPQRYFSWSEWRRKRLVVSENPKLEWVFPFKSSCA